MNNSFASFAEVRGHPDAEARGRGARDLHPHGEEAARGGRQPERPDEREVHDRPLRGLRHAPPGEDRVRALGCHQPPLHHLQIMNC